MKSMILLSLILTTCSCYTQNNTPGAVRQAFAKSFPDVTVKKWEKEDGNYEANFFKDGKTMSAIFDATGMWIETEIAIEIKDLPAAVTSYVKDHYKSAAIQEAAILKTPEGEKYEAEVEGKDVLFDMNGQFLGEEKN